MTKQEFLNICQRVGRGETICVERDDGKEGKVVGCIMGSEEFEVKVKDAIPLELWYRTSVVKEVPC